MLRNKWPSGLQSDINDRQAQTVSYLTNKGLWIPASVFIPRKCKDKTLRRWRQDDHRFEDGLHYKVRPYLRNKAFQSLRW